MASRRDFALVSPIAPSKRLHAYDLSRHPAGASDASSAGAAAAAGSVNGSRYDESVYTFKSEWTDGQGAPGEKASPPTTQGHSSFVSESGVPSAGGAGARPPTGGGLVASLAALSMHEASGVPELDELARTVDVAARTHGALEARFRELGAMSQSFKWTTVEAREALLQHFERLRQTLVDALDARQLTLLRRLEAAAQDRQLRIVDCKQQVRRAAVALSEECSRCREALREDGVAGVADSRSQHSEEYVARRATSLTASLQATVRKASQLPQAPPVDTASFGVATNDALMNAVSAAMEKEGEIVGYQPKLEKKVIRDQAPRVVTIDLSRPGVLRPLKTNKAKRAYVHGYQWKRSSSNVDVYVRSVRVKLVLSQGATGHAIIMSRSGERLAKGSLFPSQEAVNPTNQHTSPTVGLRWYESHFPADNLPKLSRGSYVLAAVSGHGTAWLCSDGGPTGRSFRSVPSPRSRQAAGTTRVGGGGGNLLSARHSADRRRRAQARAKSGKPGVDDGSALRAKVRSVSHRQGQPLAPASLAEDVCCIAMQLTLKVQDKPYVEVTEVEPSPSVGVLSSHDPDHPASLATPTTDGRFDSLRLSLGRSSHHA